MDSFAKTASLQSIENEVLKVLMKPKAADDKKESAQDEPQELTFQQTGLYLDCVKNPSSTAYNLPFILTLPEGVGAIELKAALVDILKAHPVLTGRFEQQDGKVLMVPGLSLIHI